VPVLKSRAYRRSTSSSRSSKRRRRDNRALAIRGELLAKDVKVQDSITDLSRDRSKVVKKALSARGVIYAIRLQGFKGLIGREILPGRRLGTEFSDRAKRAAGVGGIFHSDELPNYGITQTEVDAVFQKLGLAGDDAFVLVADTKAKSKTAMEAVIRRAREALIGVPEETRGAQPNGTRSTCGRWAGRGYRRLTCLQ
jgi:glutamyl-tRNA(Gln) amidotransferase subunit E